MKHWIKLMNYLKEKKMDKMAARLRGFPREGDDIHIFNLYIDNEMFKNFKTQCVIEGVTVREKLIELVESSLG